MTERETTNPNVTGVAGPVYNDDANVEANRDEAGQDGGPESDETARKYGNNEKAEKAEGKQSKR